MALSRINASMVGTNGTISNAEYEYLNGTTSAIQTQIDGVGGKILQVVSDTGNSSTASTSSTSWQDIDTIGTITPSATSSKVLVMLTYMMYSHTGGGDTGGSGKIVRNSTTDIGLTQTLYISATASTPAYQGNFFNMILDSPSSSSAVQYNLYQRAQYGGTIQTGYTWECVLMEVGV